MVVDAAINAQKIVPMPVSVPSDLNHITSQIGAFDEQSSDSLNDVFVSAYNHPVSEKSSLDRPRTAFRVDQYNNVVGDTSRRPSLPAALNPDYQRFVNERRASLPVGNQTPKASKALLPTHGPEEPSKLAARGLVRPKLDPINETSLGGRAGNTINKFWKSLYFDQIENSKLDSAWGDTTNSTANLSQAPKLDLSICGPNKHSTLKRPKETGKQKQQLESRYETKRHSNLQPQPEIRNFPVTASSLNVHSLDRFLSGNTFKETSNRPSTNLDQISNPGFLITPIDLQPISFAHDSSSDSDDITPSESMITASYQTAPSKFESSLDLMPSDASISTRSSVQGPRPLPVEWEEEISFNLDEAKTSTTNKKFKEIFLSKKKSMTNNFKKTFSRNSDSKSFRDSFVSSSSSKETSRLRGPREMPDSIV